MKKTAVIFIFAVSILFGCVKNNDNIDKEYISPKYKIDSSDSVVNRIKFSVIERGDTVAYKELEELYKERKDFNFYVYSRVMVDRYGYMPACVNVYRSLMDRDTLSKDLQLIALEYLQRAIEHGDMSAVSEMRKYKTYK